MKILSLISRGHKGSSFESSMFDVPLHKFALNNRHEYLNIDPEYVYSTELRKTEMHDRKEAADGLGKFIFKKIIKSDPDVIFVPVGNNDNHNIILPPHPAVVYVVTRDYEKLSPGMIPDDSHVVVFNSRQKRILGKHCMRLFPPLNPYMFFTDPDLKRDASAHVDVSFFGKYSHKRHEFLKFLNDNGVQVRAYGDGWFDLGVQDGYDKSGIKTAPRRNPTFQREILNRTKIGVVMDSAIKPIHFEIPACGALLVSNCGQGYFNNKEIKRMPTFKKKEQLLEIVKHYLNAEYGAGAEQARIDAVGEQKRHVMEKYTTDAFFKKVFRKVIKGRTHGEEH